MNQIRFDATAKIITLEPNHENYENQPNDENENSHYQNSKEMFFKAINAFNFNTIQMYTINHQNSL